MDRTAEGMRLNLLAVACATFLVVGPSATADAKVRKNAEPTLGPASFDAQGADFTAWVNQFKNQLYKQWVLPPATLEGRRLRLKVELTVERSGAVSRVRVLERSSDPDFDKAAKAAVDGALFLPLPDAFPAPRVTIELPFTYDARKHK